MLSSRVTRAPEESASSPYKVPVQQFSVASKGRFLKKPAHTSSTSKSFLEEKASEGRRVEKYGSSGKKNIFTPSQPSQQTCDHCVIGNSLLARFPTNESMVQAFNSNPIAYIKAPSHAGCRCGLEFVSHQLSQVGGAFRIMLEDAFQINPMKPIGGIQINLFPALLGKTILVDSYVWNFQPPASNDRLGGVLPNRPSSDQCYECVQGGAGALDRET